MKSIKISIIPFLFFVLLLKLNTSNNTTDYLYFSDAKDTVIKIKEHYLEMKGVVRQSKGNEKIESVPLDSALITIYTGDIPYSDFFTNKKGKCTFKLPLNKQFKIEVSKAGFVSKFFEVDTKIPNDKKGEYSFAFDIDIFEETNNLDVSVLKKPIAKVNYSIIQEQFIYDVNYTSRINFELKKMYKNYYLLQKTTTDSINSVPNPANPINQKTKK